MATITLAQASLRSTDQVERGIVNTLLQQAPALGVFPITTVYGNSLAYNRVVSDISSHLVAADGTITDSSPMVIKRVHADIVAMSGQGDVPNLMLRQGIGAGELKAAVIQSASNELARNFLKFMVTGTVATNGFDGLATIVTNDTDFADQVIDDAGAFSLNLIDDAQALVMTAGQKFIMGNARLESKFKQAFRALGGATTQEINGQYFTSYDGMVFLRNDNIPTTGGLTDAYVFTMGNGLVDSGSLNLLTTPGDLFTLEQFDYLEMKSAYRGRVIMDMGLAIGNPKSVAVVRGIAV